MTIQTTASVSSHSRIRRVRAGILALITMALFGLLAAAALRYARPQWYTWRSLYYPDIKAAFSIDYPDDWYVRNASTQYAGQIFHHIAIGHRKPTGPERWFRETVLRQDPRLWDTERVEFGMDATNSSVAETESALAYFGMGYVEGVRQSTGSKVAVHRFKHPVGSALEMTYVTAPRGVKPTGLPMGTRLFSRLLVIFVPHKKATGGMFITVRCEMPQDVYQRNRATLDRIFQRFRVVEK